MLPHDLPPWQTVGPQPQRGGRAEVFEAITQARRMRLRALTGRAPQPTAAILDGRTRPSRLARGARAGYDGAKRRAGSTVHGAVDRLGHLLALTGTPANEQARAQGPALAAAVQAAPDERGAVALVAQGYPGPDAAEAAAAPGLRLSVVKLPGAQQGFVLLPRRWVGARSLAWAARCRRLARAYARLAAPLRGLQLRAFTILMLRRFVTLMAEYA